MPRQRVATAPGNARKGRRGFAAARNAGRLADSTAIARGMPDTAAMSRKARRRNRSEEHTSELQSLMRLSYAVFCLKKKYILSFRLGLLLQRQTIYNLFNLVYL